jgi:hypothetical protein
MIATIPVYSPGVGVAIAVKQTGRPTSDNGDSRPIRPDYADAIDSFARLNLQNTASPMIVNCIIPSFSPLRGSWGRQMFPIIGNESPDKLPGAAFELIEIKAHRLLRL